MSWLSNPIKVNRWNFMSFVSNVASIKMAPLWSYDNMDSHWIGVWIPMVNGTWVPLISLAYCKKNTFFKCWKPQDWIEIIGLVCKLNSFSYVFNPNMQYLEAQWNHLVSCFGPHSHISPNCFMFVIYFFGHVT